MCFEECEDGWKLTANGIKEVATFLGVINQDESM